MTAVSSMRLLVVCASPPKSSFSWPFHARIAPQPPGPGLPLHAPSVWMVTEPLIAGTAAVPCRAAREGAALRRSLDAFARLPRRGRDGGLAPLPCRRDDAHAE